MVKYSVKQAGESSWPNGTKNPFFHKEVRRP
jgi:hypothetical protein